MVDLRIEVESRDGLCLLRVSGELDFLNVGEFAEGAGQAMRAVPGPVVVDLSCLMFIDVRGACALAAAAQSSPAGRQVVICSCPPQVRLVLDALGLTLNYLPPDCLPTRRWTAPVSSAPEAVNRVREARLHASVAKLHATGVLARLTDSSIRLANTRERTGLTREQGRQALASARAAREHVIRSR